MKSGFAVLIGRSNTGKSTLLNSLVGSKISIVTPKPQTTRLVIHGVVHDPRGQIVFVDTPGIFEKSHSELTRELNEKAKDALGGVDVILYVADPSRAIGNEERIVLRIIEPLKIPKILVLNKADQRLPYLDEYLELSGRFAETIQVSAKTGKNLKPLKEKIIELLPEGEPIYPEFQITNLEHKTWLKELIREKIYIQLSQELPYTTNVEIEEEEERKNGVLYIKANIITDSPNHRKIIIGKGGRKIKEIGSVARKELEQILGRKIYLELEVQC
jgi:GTP-binding protein Era